MKAYHKIISIILILSFFSPLHGVEKLKDSGSHKVFSSNYLAPMSYSLVLDKPFRGHLSQFILSVLNRYESSKEGVKKKLVSFKKDQMLFFHSIDINACHVLFNGIRSRVINENGEFEIKKTYGESKVMGVKGKTNRDSTMENAIKLTFEKALRPFEMQLIMGDEREVDRRGSYKTPKGSENLFENLYRDFRNAFLDRDINPHVALKGLIHLSKLCDLTVKETDYEDTLKVAFENLLGQEMSRRQVIQASRLLKAMIVRLRKNTRFREILVEDLKVWKKNREVLLNDLFERLYGKKSDMGLDPILETSLEGILKQARHNRKLREKLKKKASEYRRHNIRNIIKEKKSELKAAFEEEKKTNPEIVFSKEWKELKAAERWGKEIDLKTRKLFTSFVFHNDYNIELGVSSTSKEAPKGVIPVKYDHYTKEGRGDIQTEEEHMLQMRQALPRKGRLLEIERRWDIIRQLEALPGTVDRHIQQINESLKKRKGILSDLKRQLRDKEKEKNTLTEAHQKLAQKLKQKKTNKTQSEVNRLSARIRTLNEEITALTVKVKDAQENFEGVKENFKNEFEKGTYQKEVYKMKIEYQKKQIQGRLNDIRPWLTVDIPSDTRQLSRDINFYDPSIWKEEYTDSKGKVKAVPKEGYQIIEVPNMKAVKGLGGNQHLDPNDNHHWVRVLALNGRPITGDWDVFETGVVAENKMKKLSKRIHDRSRLIRKNKKKGIGQRVDRELFNFINRAFQTVAHNTPIQHHASQHSELVKKADGSSLGRIDPSFPLVALFQDKSGKYVCREIKDEGAYQDFLAEQKIVVTKNPLITPEALENVSKLFDRARRFLSFKQKSS